MMLNKIIKIIFISLILNTSLINLSISEIVKEIKINGNNRISKETILMFSQIDIDQDLDNQDLNILLKNLYETNYFENVSVKLSNNLLEIEVIENPIIQDINYEGIKSNRIKNLIVGQAN